MKFLLVFILLFTFILGYFFVLDDPLDQEVEALITHYNNNHQIEDNGSIFQLGYWADISDSAEQIGLWRLNQYKSALSRLKEKEKVTFEDYPEEYLISEVYPDQDNPEFLCDIQQPSCFNYLYKNIESIMPLTQEKFWYIDRYDELMTFDTFTLYAKPSHSLPEPDFGPSSDILQLKLIDIIHNVKAGDIQLAIAKIKQLIIFHKNVLEQTPYIAPKIMSIIELEMVIETTSFLISKTPPENREQWQAIIIHLTPLTNEQLSMKKTFVHDFIAQVNSLNNVDIARYSVELPEIVNFLPSRLLYKKNMTINMLYQWMTSNHGLLSFKNGKVVEKKKNNVKAILAFTYQNPVGSILAAAMAPKLLNLEHFLYEIEVKQQMLKFLFSSKKNSTLVDIFKSPYTDNPAEINGQMFCVSTDSDSENDICITYF